VRKAAVLERRLTVFMHKFVAQKMQYACGANDCPEITTIQPDAPTKNGAELHEVDYRDHQAFQAR
jgi:hypothetical protein